MPSPKEVVNKWVDAFNVGDVDMIISLYDNNLCKLFDISADYLFGITKF